MQNKGSTNLSEQVAPRYTSGCGSPAFQARSAARKMRTRTCYLDTPRRPRHSTVECEARRRHRWVSSPRETQRWLLNSRETACRGEGGESRLALRPPPGGSAPCKTASESRWRRSRTVCRRGSRAARRGAAQGMPFTCEYSCDSDEMKHSKFCYVEALRLCGPIAMRCVVRAGCRFKFNFVNNSL